MSTGPTELRADIPDGGFTYQLYFGGANPDATENYPRFVGQSADFCPCLQIPTDSPVSSQFTHFCHKPGGDTQEPRFQKPTGA